MQTVDHSAIAFLEHGPAVSVLLGCLHEDAEKEHHTPIPTAVQACFKIGAGPLVEWWWRDDENKVHPHVVAIDKLAAKEVLVTWVKAALDLDLSPVFTMASSSVAMPMLHAPMQPSNITAMKLFVTSV